ncbi:uncharacterized protein HMPREF1541_10824 [Cyphellophora europaea CBS 101466]|uniref:Carrier domain-containing protein n=1 Tax=Cyphellophora europaea (strain CBS 101466) TaxID=1220924 RepID=W2S7S4_CYPE1|nr:uncharacterized protein HMPREF1541_10824 [Cyphellophora europaea CBS 101466]ETN43959.1 hypothetical protein HMPREF1541_10824 [Cyphellophora europaea CBS 101466]
MSADLSYFTCTLGQAALLKQSKAYKTIPEFIDYQAEHYPNHPAVGCYTPQPAPDSWPHQVITFADVQRGTRLIAEHLQPALGRTNGETVALLWPSSVEFLFTWLGLVYAGHPVLLIAPQCSSSAIASLCQTSAVSVIIRHGIYEKLAADACEQARESGEDLQSMSFSFANGIQRKVRDSPATTPRRADVSPEDVAYLHHTSGTSSGTPKPIPQTHHGGLAVLPRLEGQRAGTFTTTPLYHGGIADLFRAWTSNAMIWLFPGADVPITSANVAHCLRAAAGAHLEGEAPIVAHFSSVPYVLQLLAADDEGLKRLQSMDMVGVGGAALPVEVGDGLVLKGVRLVSRYGSAECGFLLSSNRKYESDQDWQYLRHDAAVDSLSFEEREGGLYELIVRKDWPHMAKRNRDDGGYDTSDLFERHPSIENAYRYHSRADSQLTLITGKKFDPAPLEGSIASTSDLVEDAMIFGEGQPYPGVLLFRSRSSADVANQEIVAALRSTIAKMNTESQSHARIPLDMLIPMPPAELEKSSKGTILRPVVTGRFAKEIQAAYKDTTTDGSDQDMPDSDVAFALLSAVSSILGSDSGGKLTPETDLFAHGIDSVASIQIRNKLWRMLPNGTRLPLTIVQDCGSVAKLAQYVLALRHGRTMQLSSKTDLKHTHGQMKGMVEEYCDFPSSSSHSETPSTANDSSTSTELPDSANSNTGTTILMTGCTGTLGAHLLSHLLTHAPALDIQHVYLLVRGSTPHASTSRVHKALLSRQLSVPPTFSSLVSVLPCKLSNANLGLEDAVYQRLAQEVTLIYHLSWHVSFLAPLTAFRTHIAAVQNLLSLTLARAPTSPLPSPHFVFCSSTASASSHPSPIPEQLLAKPDAAGPTGYARSKWVAEQVCGRFAAQSQLRGRVSIMRVGQLSGSTRTGCWGGSEAYPLMLGVSKAMGEVPDLDEAKRRYGGEECAWVPVDVAAQAFAELGLLGTHGSPSSQKMMTGNGGLVEEGSAQSTTGYGGLQVLHLLPKPTHKHSTWSDVLACIAEREPDAFRVVPVDPWLDHLEQLRDSKEEVLRAHPALQLADFWRKSYCSESGGERGIAGKHDGADILNQGEAADGGEGEELRGEPLQEMKDARESSTSGFVMANSLEAMPILKDRPIAVHLDGGYVVKCWQWIKENI